MKDLLRDIMADSHIKFKIIDSDKYAQNVYAALCNNIYETTTKDVTDWICSWRTAARMVSEVREEGDYLDWYCSGMFVEQTSDSGYVQESIITEEIRKDFLCLGWQCVPDKVTNN